MDGKNIGVFIKYLSMFLKKISQFFSSKNKLSFKVIKDIEEAKKWWEYFTPHQVIFDEWEFRYCFYKYFNYDLHFYLGFIKDEPIGLLPLQYDPERKYLEFFGGPPMDDNDVFIKTGYEKYVKNFFEKSCKKEEIGPDNRGRAIMGNTKI
jgi:cell division protein FtsI/penicillin-binding protein 2